MGKGTALRSKVRERREAKQNRKRMLKGDPVTLKLKNSNPPVSISGKRKRKLLRKWRREQKVALEKGLVTMNDIQNMAIDDPPQDNTVEGSSKGPTTKAPVGLSMKKRAKLRMKRNKRNKPVEKSVESVSVGDAMVE